MLCFVARKDVNNTPVFRLLLSSAVTASVLSLQPPSAHPTASRLRVNKRLGGVVAKTIADSNWLKGYFIPYDAMLSIKDKRKKGQSELVIKTLVFPMQLLHVPRPCLPGNGWTLPTDEK